MFLSLALLATTPFVIGSEHESAEIQSLDQTSTYLDNLGETQLFHKTSNPIGYLDVSAIKNRLRISRRHIGEILKICSSHCSYNSDAEELNRRVQRLDDDLNECLRSADMIRPNRDASDFVGDVAILFGTLSEKDAKRYNDAIDERYRRSSDTIDSVKSSTRKEEQNDLGDPKSLMKTYNVIANLSEDVNYLSRAIDDGRRGIVNREIFQRMQFMEGLPKIGNSTTESTILSLEASEFNEIIKISEVVVAIMNERFVYIFKSPVPELPIFSTYQVRPLPKKISEYTYGFVQPREDYIIMNKDKSACMPGSIEHSTSCVNFYQRKLCKHPYPDISNATTKNCEACIINGGSNEITDEVCTIKIVRISRRVWIPLNSGNGWIVISPKPGSMDIECDHPALRTVVLQGTQILTLKDRCTYTVKTDRITLRADKNSTYEQKLSILVNKTVNFRDIKDTLLSSTPNVTDIEVNEIAAKRLTTKMLKEIGITVDNFKAKKSKVQSDSRSKSRKDIIEIKLEFLEYLFIILVVILITLKRFTIFRWIFKSLKWLCVSTCNDANTRRQPTFVVNNYINNSYTFNTSQSTIKIHQLGGENSNGITEKKRRERV